MDTRMRLLFVDLLDLYKTINAKKKKKKSPEVTTLSVN